MKLQKFASFALEMQLKKMVFIFMVTLSHMYTTNMQQKTLKIIKDLKCVLFGPKFHSPKYAGA